MTIFSRQNFNRTKPTLNDSREYLEIYTLEQRIISSRSFGDYLFLIFVGLLFTEDLVYRTEHHFTDMGYVVVVIFSWLIIAALVSLFSLILINYFYKNNLIDELCSLYVKSRHLTPKIIEDKILNYRGYKRSVLLIFPIEFFNFIMYSVVAYVVMNLKNGYHNIFLLSFVDTFSAVCVIMSIVKFFTVVLLIIDILFYTEDYFNRRMMKLKYRTVKL